MRLTTNIILFFIISVGICLTGCKSQSKQNQIAIVKTTNGTISGSSEDGIFIFRGIPYAKAERFMPPQAPDTWDGVLECNEFGSVAKQIVAWIPDSTMNEKDLFSVNVWTQGLSDGKKRGYNVF